MATLTIKDQVRNTVKAMSGGTDYTLPVIYWRVDNVELGLAQVKRALRDIPFVKRVAAGTYRIKGRKVPQR